MKHKPIQPPQNRHPSGRPITKERRGIISRPKKTDDEPLTPGLRDRDLPEAFGFIHDFTTNDDDDEEFDYTRETE